MSRVIHLMHPISRRQHLAALGAVLGLLLIPFPAAAQFKTNKETAKYQEHPNGKEHCGICPHFQEPDRCEIVEGEIDANSWCRYFGTKL